MTSAGHGVKLQDGAGHGGGTATGPLAPLERLGPAPPEPPDRPAPATHAGPWRARPTAVGGHARSAATAPARTRSGDVSCVGPPAGRLGPVQAPVKVRRQHRGVEHPLGHGLSEPTRPPVHPGLLVAISQGRFRRHDVTRPTFPRPVTPAPFTGRIRAIEGPKAVDLFRVSLPLLAADPVKRDPESARPRGRPAACTALASLVKKEWPSAPIAVKCHPRNLNRIVILP